MNHYVIMDIAITYSWNTSYIFLSVMFAFFGSFASTLIAEQFRINKSKQNFMYLFGMAINLGGVAIGNMHFIGMGALRLISDYTIIVSYNVWLTILSILCSILCVGIGLYFASRDGIFTSLQNDLARQVINDTPTSSTSTSTHSKLYFKAMTRNLLPIVFGGVCASIGVCTMHYIGMVAQIMSVEGQGSLMMMWDYNLVAVSVIIAVVASIAAFWILFRLLAIFPYTVIRVVCSLVMTVAVCAMHYTGMYACIYEFVPEKVESSTDYSFIISLLSGNGILLLSVFLMI